MDPMRKIGLFLGIFVAALAAGAIPSEAQLASPTARPHANPADGIDDYGEITPVRRMRGRKNFRRSGSLWRGLARGSDDATSFVSELWMWSLGGRRTCPRA